MTKLLLAILLTSLIGASNPEPLENVIEFGHHNKPYENYHWCLTTDDYTRLTIWAEEMQYLLNQCNERLSVKKMILCIE